MAQRRLLLLPLPAAKLSALHLLSALPEPPPLLAVLLEFSAERLLGPLKDRLGRRRSPDGPRILGAFRPRHGDELHDLLRRRLTRLDRFFRRWQRRRAWRWSHGWRRGKLGAPRVILVEPDLSQQPEKGGRKVTPPARRSSDTRRDRDRLGLEDGRRRLGRRRLFKRMVLDGCRVVRAVPSLLESVPGLLLRHCKEQGRNRTLLKP